MTIAVSAKGASQQGQRRHDKYDRLVATAQSLPKLKVAVAHPCDAASLGAVFEAVGLGLIDPILGRTAGQDYRSCGGAWQGPL
jgi:phosphate acetyltransferase